MPLVLCVCSVCVRPGQKIYVFCSLFENINFSSTWWSRYVLSENRNWSEAKKERKFTWAPQCLFHPCSTMSGTFGRQFPRQTCPLKCTYTPFYCPSVQWLINPQFLPSLAWRQISGHEWATGNIFTLGTMQPLCSTHWGHYGAPWEILTLHISLPCQGQRPMLCS